MRFLDSPNSAWGSKDFTTIGGGTPLYFSVALQQMIFLFRIKFMHSSQARRKWLICFGLEKLFRTEIKVKYKRLLSLLHGNADEKEERPRITKPWRRQILGYGQQFRSISLNDQYSFDFRRRILTTELNL